MLSPEGEGRGGGHSIQNPARTPKPHTPPLDSEPYLVLVSLFPRRSEEREAHILVGEGGGGGRDKAVQGVQREDYERAALHGQSWGTPFLSPSSVLSPAPRYLSVSARVCRSFGLALRGGFKMWEI